MKKVLFGSAFALLTIVVLSSCKKDYTCKCTTTDSSGSGSSSTKNITINGKKKDVKKTCENGNLTVGTLSTSCTID